jgi:hypothetical protein
VPASQRQRRAVLPVIAVAATACAFYLGRGDPPAAPLSPAVVAAPDDWKVADLVASLSERGLGLHAVPASARGDVEGGVYLCAQPRARGDLQKLPRLAQLAGRWGGVVFCQREGTGAPLTPGDLASWGEHGMVAGPFVLFGDPELLARVRAALEEEGAP